MTRPFPRQQFRTRPVETPPDGSLPIPVLAAELVSTERLVARERAILRTHTVDEEQVVSADLQRERLEVEATGNAVATDEGQVFAMSTPDGRTPDAPDVDQPDGGAHGGELEGEAAGRVPGAPDVDQPDGGAHPGGTPQR